MMADPTDAETAPVDASSPELDSRAVPDSHDRTPVLPSPYESKEDKSEDDEVKDHELKRSSSNESSSDLEREATERLQIAADGGAAELDGRGSDVEIEGDRGGLFGSGSEDEDDDEGSQTSVQSELPDGEGQASGDHGRAIDEHYDSDDDSNKKILEVELGKHAGPESTNGELYLFRLPSFLGLEPHAFDPATFRLPTKEHHSTDLPSPTFSPYEVATTTVRWRRSPKDPNKLESNSRVLVWSDGSMTLQIANKPSLQYELIQKTLAPSNRKTSSSALPSRGNEPVTAQEEYDPRLDTHTYLTAPYESAQVLRLTNHVTKFLSVLPSSAVHDNALLKLQKSLAAATQKKRIDPLTGVGMIYTNEDPELAKKNAEIAEKERLKQQRKLQNIAQRELDRANRFLGKSGLSRNGGGLSVGALESGGDDDRGPGAGRKRTAAPRKPVLRARYSDDEDNGPGARAREDEYDKTDDFVDDDSEVEGEVEADEDEEEEAEESNESGESEVEPVPPKKRTSNRARAKPEKKRRGEGATGTSRKKRRRVIEDDEDE